MVRTSGELEPLLHALRENLRVRHPDLPLIAVRTQVQQIDRQLAQQVLFAQLSGAFGSVVALMVGIGLYGLISYAVLRRTV